MIRRHPVLSYFVLAFLITWPFHGLAFIAADRAGVAVSNEDNFVALVEALGTSVTWDGLLPFVVYNIGQFGPAIAAFVVTAAIYGRAGVRDLAGRTFRPRTSARWYLIGLGLPLGLASVGIFASLLVGGFRSPEFSPLVPWTLLVPFLLYVIIFNGFAEEPGWRGFALPHLQARHSADRASWILGPVWGLWHLPFLAYLNRAEPMALIPVLFALTIGIVGWTIVNTWLYNSTRSVLLLVLVHASYVAVQSYLILSLGNPIIATIYSVVPWGIAIFLVKRYGEEHLNSRPRPQWWPGTYPIERRQGEGPAS
jgi:hypothetical protein